MENVYEDFKDSVGFKRYLFLLRIAECGSRVTGIEKVEIIRKVSLIREELDLHELELVLFYIYLERFGWNDPGDKDQVLWFVAYAAKNFLNDFSIDIEHKLILKHKFFTSYRDWVNNYRKYINVGYADLNSTYNKLCRSDVTSEEIDPFDYNMAVTQLIETSTRPDRVM